MEKALQLPMVGLPGGKLRRERGREANMPHNSPGAAVRASASVTLTMLLALTPARPLAAQSGAPAPTQLHVVVVEGEGAVYTAQRRASSGPVVRVEDQKRRPVSGATVLFMLPDSGPGGTFGGGKRTLLVRTDSAGRAAVKGFRANDILGKFEMQVQASLRGVVARASIAQANAELPAAKRKSGTRRLLVLLGVAGGAAAAGAVVASRSGEANGPTLTVTAGTPSVGGPR
ncbi:MAG: hypothetical protein IT159_13665 [Bryobacterales bacterium]|nr:hypothetical protein [Bryobacterales bacterium]